MKADVLFKDSFTEGLQSFDSVEVDASDGRNLTIRLQDAEGRGLDLSLDRKQVKKMISWKMLMSL
ncbi:hypothetical protein [Magnetospira sp. QH-2]|uniref:hypothetical protein n=1 Tax=Magnetospira sp. (strain QH-2) TaxID=1288970 RepID=UPI0005FA284C|nr:hypothetical protein [Magnetospira sp. QH-2]